MDTSGSIADIITQFAEYLSLIFSLLKDFIAGFTKKSEDKTQEATSETAAA